MTVRRNRMEGATTSEVSAMVPGNGTWRFTAAILALGALSLHACSGGADSPNGAIVDLMKALNEDDTTTVVALVDFEQVAIGMESEVPALRQGDSTRTPGAIIRASLLGEGFLRSRWTKMQVVVNETELHGDTALVEVSFVDRVTGVQYYNKWRLVLPAAGDTWRVTSFKTL